MNLSFLVSGNGGNLKFIKSCINKGFINNCKLIVIADRECGALNYSKDNSIENYLIKYSRKKNMELIKLLDSVKPDLIITNIHKILDEKLVEIYKGKMINLHYSLLPAYSGLIGEDPIIRAMDYSMFIGTTLHYVEKEVDAGKVIIQGVIKNTGEKSEIINKIFRMGCFSILYYIYSTYPELKHSKLKESVEQEEYIFSPDINFNVNMFSEEFWNELRR